MGWVGIKARALTIKKNGEFKSTRKTWAFALLVIIVVVLLIIYVAFSFGMAGARQIMSLAYPFAVTVFATQTSLYLSWERRQKKQILLEGDWVGRLYVSPGPGKT